MTDDGQPTVIVNRKTNLDHAKKTARPMVEDEVVASQLEALLTPAITAQENYYRQLGLRDRILNLPLMVAAVLTLLWPDVAGVTELTRILAREGLLWCSPKTVTQQAISQRFMTFPACLFEKIFKDLLPHLRTAWHSRTSRPIPESSYLWTGSLNRHLQKLDFSLSITRVSGSFLEMSNGIQLQIWGTWLFYAVLVDLGDAVAEELSLPFDQISLEMIYRGLYHFSVAYQKGIATDPVKYFAARENQDLGIVKHPRKPFVKLIVAPFPEQQRGSDQFFFPASYKIPLTTASKP